MGLGGVYLLRGKKWGFAHSDDVWDVRRSSDTTVMLLLGATGLTVDRRAWQNLANIYKHHTGPTTIVLFETKSSPLGSSDYARKLGGGYYFLTFDLQLIGQYLRSSKDIPEEYQMLFCTWDRARSSRKALSDGFSKLKEGEGSGRRIPVSARARARERSERP